MAVVITGAVALICFVFLFLIPKLWMVSPLAKSEGTLLKENIVILQKRTSKNMLFGVSTPLSYFDRFLLLIPLYWKTIILMYFLVPSVGAYFLFMKLKEQENLDDASRKYFFLDIQDDDLAEDFVIFAVGLWISFYYFALAGVTFILESFLGIADWFKILFSILPVSFASNIYQDCLHLSMLVLSLVLVTANVHLGDRPLFEKTILEPLLTLFLCQLGVLFKFAGIVYFVIPDSTSYHYERLSVKYLRAIHYAGIFLYVYYLPNEPQTLVLLVWGTSFSANFFLSLFQCSLLKVQDLALAKNEENRSLNYAQRFWGIVGVHLHNSAVSLNRVGLKKFSLQKGNNDSFSVGLGEYRWLFTVNVFRQWPRFLTITSSLSEDSNYLAYALCLERHLPKGNYFAPYHWSKHTEIYEEGDVCLSGTLYLSAFIALCLVFLIQIVVLLTSAPIILSTMIVNCMWTPLNSYRGVLGPPKVRSLRHLYLGSRDHVVFMVSDAGINAGCAYLKECIEASLVYNLSTKIIFIFEITEFESVVLLLMLLRKLKAQILNFDWSVLKQADKDNDLLCFFFYTGKQRRLLHLMSALRDKYPEDSELLEWLFVQRVHTPMHVMRSDLLFSDCKDKSLAIATIGSESAARKCVLLSRRVKNLFSYVKIFHSVVPTGIEYS